MKERIDENGTLYSYATASFYMIYALLALGHSLQSSLIQKAIAGITSYIWKMERGSHLQNSPSTVWDTALLSYALQEAHVPKDHKMIQQTITYLLKTAYKKLIGAYMLPHLPWRLGFSDVNTTVPDVDDTTAVLRVLARSRENEKVNNAWQKGIDWVKGLQNNDGGWGAFEKGVTSKLLANLPIENASDMITDPSTPDITGRVLELFGTYTQNELPEKQNKVR